MSEQIMTVSPDVFSQMKDKQAELYDFLCVDHDMAFRGWLRDTFAIERGVFRVVVDYSKPRNYWSFRFAAPSQPTGELGE